jgi:hypothetical protein
VRVRWDAAENSDESRIYLTVSISNQLHGPSLIIKETKVYYSI